MYHFAGSRRLFRQSAQKLHEYKCITVVDYGQYKFDDARHIVTSVKEVPEVGLL